MIEENKHIENAEALIAKLLEARRSQLAKAAGEKAVDADALDRVLKFHRLVEGLSSVLEDERRRALPLVEES